MKSDSGPGWTSSGRTTRSTSASQVHEPATEHYMTHVRRLRARAWMNRLRDSLLFLPLMMLIATIAAEEAVAALDRRVDLTLSARYALSPGTASALLATIAGATITTAGVVFSLLVVTLQLASGQFSPRVLRTFWRDWQGHVLIGLLLSTFTFCVLALTQIDTAARYAPTLTMQAALLLTVAAIIGIAAYLNRISHEQYVGRIVERITGETLRLVRQLPYGTNVGMKVGEPCNPPDVTRLGPPLVIKAKEDGWIQQISRRAVVESAPERSVIKINTRVGSYVVRGEPIVVVWPSPDRAAVARTVRHMSEAIVIGHSRTMQQDIDFGLRQLIDIALRALSPAVNDPTTAIEVILRISSALRPLVTAPLPAQAVTAPGGRVLLTPWDLDHTEYIAHGFAQLRVYAAPHPQVVIAIIRALTMLREAATSAGNIDAAAACETQLRLTLDGAGRAHLLPADLEQIQQQVHGLADDAAEASSGTRQYR